jgi:hypothetical protein
MNKREQLDKQCLRDSICAYNNEFKAIIIQCSVAATEICYQRESSLVSET